jgi:hypothetical protein
VNPPASLKKSSMSFELRVEFLLNNNPTNVVPKPEPTAAAVVVMTNFLVSVMPHFLATSTCMPAKNNFRKVVACYSAVRLKLAAEESRRMGGRE